MIKNEIDIEIGKNSIDFSEIDIPSNNLPPQKKVGRNQYIDMYSKKNNKFSSANNINIDNFLNDETEEGKSNIDNKELQKNKSKFKDKKNKLLKRSRKDYCKYDDDTNKVCGCIGEQTKSLCTIF